MTSTEKSRTTIALITGAGREGGLGHEVARQLAAKGHHVILTARDLSQVEPLADAINAEGLSASALQLDLTDEDSVTTAVRAVAEVTAVDGRAVALSVTAYDEREEIGSGTHTRFAVASDTFMAKAEGER